MPISRPGDARMSRSTLLRRGHDAVFRGESELQDSVQRIRPSLARDFLGHPIDMAARS